MSCYRRGKGVCKRYKVAIVSERIKSYMAAWCLVSCCYCCFYSVYFYFIKPFSLREYLNCCFTKRLEEREHLFKLMWLVVVLFNELLLLGIVFILLSSKGLWFYLTSPLLLLLYYVIRLLTVWRLVLFSWI